MSVSQISSPNTVVDHPSLESFNANEFFVKNEHTDEKFIKAMQVGLLYIEIPDKIKPGLSDLLQLIDRFEADEEKLQSLELGPIGGLIKRQNSQLQQLLAERQFWPILNNEGVLSQDAMATLDYMTQLGNRVVVMALETLNLPRESYLDLSGGISEDKSDIFLSLHKYDAAVEEIGLKEHIDFGYATLVYSKVEGLEAHINKQWVKVTPSSDHFIFNFGEVFQTAINSPSSLSAIKHRVKRVQKDRSSIVLFFDGDLKMPTYRYNWNRRDISQDYSSHQDYLVEHIQKDFPEAY